MIGFNAIILGDTVASYFKNQGGALSKQQKQDTDFAQCVMCKGFWEDLDAFLHDKDLVFSGYQPHFDSPDKGCFVFWHNKADCGTSFLVRVSQFKKLLGREVEFKPFVGGGDPECDLRCMRETDFTPCPAKNCNGTVIRDLMQVVKQYMQTTPDVLPGNEVDSIIENYNSQKGET